MQRFVFVLNDSTALLKTAGPQCWAYAFLLLALVSGIKYWRMGAQVLET